MAQVKIWPLKFKRLIVLLIKGLDFSLPLLQENALHVSCNIGHRIVDGLFDDPTGIIWPKKGLGPCRPSTELLGRQAERFMREMIDRFRTPASGGGNGRNENAKL